MSFLSSWLLIRIKNQIKSKEKPSVVVGQVDLATEIVLKVKGGEGKGISRK